MTQSNPKKQKSKRKIYDLYGKSGQGSFLMRIVRILVTIWIKLFYKIEVKGADNIPESGSALIYSNHETAMDMFFIGYTQKRYIRWMAKRSLFKNKFIGGLLQRLGAFSAGSSKTSLISSINIAKELFDRGELVGIFPEGHRRKVSEQIGFKVHSGVALLGKMNDVPIIPVHLTSSGKKFSKIKVVFGEPFKLYNQEDIDNKTKLNEKYDLKSISEEMMGKLYDLN